MISESQLDQAIRVLIVDDEEDDFILTSAQINDIKSRKFILTWCSSYTAAADLMSKSQHDIYFVDYRLGAKTGLDLLREPSLQHIEEPIILLTGLGSEAVDLEAMRLGAADYLIKSELNPEKLERCIRYALERAATLKASRASERNYRNIFERTRDVIFVSDSNLVFQNINEAATEVLGLDASLPGGGGLYDLMPQESERTKLAHALRDKGFVEDAQVEVTTKNGTKVVLISASSEQDSQGRSYIQGIIHDITLLKRTEEIRLQAERLEAKSKFIRTLAHEIRNPLNNISVSIDQIKSSVSAEGIELLNIVYRGVSKINDLIRELMDSARFVKMNFAVIPLQTVVDKAVEEAMDRLILKKIKLEMSHSPTPASVLVDLENAKVALLNIILNAIEAMEESKGILKIDIHSRPNTYDVTIHDNGCGMNEEVTQRLFEPYFTAKPGGVGIGLASALAIIQSHKGTISVESTLDKGTLFTVSFPSLGTIKK